MTYEPPPDREVIVDRGGYGAGLIAGLIVAVLVILVVGWYLLGGLNPPRASSGPAQQPAPSLQLPSVAPSK